MKNKLITLVLLTGIVSLISGCEDKRPLPSYLAEYKSDYYENPRQANLKWFTNAGYGMFIHYGLYALLEKGEWVQLRDTIPVAEYALLKDRFTAEKFDAEQITD
ncbi:MAG: alpha-L-fucosidase, partial [Cyclobacteriaceae bacterium]